MNGKQDRVDEDKWGRLRGVLSRFSEITRPDEISESRVVWVRQNPVMPFSVRWRVHVASLRGRPMVHRPPAQHFQPELMNTDSMDLVRMSVKHDVSCAVRADGR